MATATSHSPKLQPRLVVGVGASAGGLEAFKRLLQALPETTGMAFLLVQHLDPRRESLLTELLAPHTGMDISEACDGRSLEPDTVYTIPPDTALAVRDGKIALTSPTGRRSARHPVDHLFRSLADQLGPRAVGIVLSGAGSDGSVGLRELRAAGGLVIAQQPQSSGQSGMPQAAIDTGCVDLVLEIPSMPEALERFAELPAKVRIEPIDAGKQADEPPKAGSLSEQQMGRLAALLEVGEDLNLPAYKPGTVERRVLRRMALTGCEDVDDYLASLERDSASQRALARDLLISVTDFFRDREAFRELRRTVIEPLIAGMGRADPLRVWVPGCATGEEAYSIAMELLDAMEPKKMRRALQVFATDIDPNAIAVARAAVYPHAISERIAPQKLHRYFRLVDDRGYQVRSVLRDTVSFAVHDLTKDPPFSHMDLVSCRNVMIYLRSEPQQRVLAALHYALQPSGYLFLGSAESLGAQRELFATLSKKWRIYQKARPSRPLDSIAPATRPPGTTRRAVEALSEPSAPRAGATKVRSDLARDAIFRARVAPTIVVAGDGSVLYIHGDLRPFLRFPQGGNPQFDLSAMVTPELATRTRASLYKCRRQMERVVALSSLDGEGPARVRIIVTPAFELGDGAVVLSFEEIREDVAAGAGDGGSSDETMVDELERELQATREDLRNTVEELEASNEELRSSNEQSMTMNEELQSANEELEATTEELRSLNEELTTVNLQLREKVDQLERANDDLHNFFFSTKIATLFLDERLRIKRFTPAAAELLQVEQADAGRYVGDLSRALLEGDLLDEARFVLDQLTPRARELRSKDGRWIARRVLPYRTESRRIEGVVVTFVDITELKTATERLATRERQQAVIARLGLRALEEPDLQSFMDQAVRDVQATLDTDFCKILEVQPESEQLFLRAGVGWREGLVGASHVGAGPDSQAGFTLRTSEPVLVEDVAADKRFSPSPLFVEHGVTSGVSCAIEGEGAPYGVIGAHTRNRRIFSREDANFLQAVASVIGSAVSRHKTRVRLALEREVAQVLGESRDSDEAVAEVLDCLSRELSASIAEVWRPASDGRAPHCRQLRVYPPLERSAVDERSSGDRSSGLGEELVGSVFSQGRALWRTDLSAGGSLLRSRVGRELGLTTGVAFPIVSGRDVVGVVALFSQRRLIGDDILLRNLEGIGRTIGDFFVRIAFESNALRLAAITESSHDAILSYGFDGRIIDWLGGAERLYGYRAEEMVGASLDRIVPGERRDEQREVDERIRRGEVVEPLETIRRRKDGSLLEVSVRSSPIRDRDGAVIGVSSTDRDVSQQKEVERQLVEADRQKDEFLAMLGHELRNPLAAVRTAAELLEAAAGDETRLRRTLEILRRQSAHMARLLDGLLDVSRIIRGKIAIDTEVVDLVGVCREVSEDVAQRISGSRTLELHCELPAEPVWVEADRIRMVQVVDNLLSNAVKYTEDGGAITLALAQQDDVAALAVRDTGVGIEPELLPRIFDVFRQARQSLDRSRGGLGLGLALVKSLVELHGGAIEARSAGRGQGAEFEVRLPLAQPPATIAHERASAGAGKLRILLVEDNEDAAEMLGQLLELAGHEVALATRGQDAVATAKDQRPDVVLCDLGLPDGMTGFDVARQLRGDPVTADVLLVALSGYGRPEDKQESSSAGFDAHLTKPVDAKAIERTLASLRR